VLDWAGSSLVGSGPVGLTAKVQTHGLLRCKHCRQQTPAPSGCRA